MDKLFDCHVEVSAFPKGLALNFSSYARDITSDITIFRGTPEFPEQPLKKTFEDAQKVDLGTFSAEYSQCLQFLLTRYIRVS